MTFVVPFDGTELAEAALLRAAEFSAVLSEDVVAVTAIPRGNADYARERGWIDEDEAAEVETIVGGLRARVQEFAPAARFEYVLVGRYAPTGTISRRLREVARGEDASIVFVGSTNAGRMVAALSSVGRSLAADETYDVLIVRDHGPATVEAVEAVSPFPAEGSPSDAED